MKYWKLSIGHSAFVVSSDWWHSLYSTHVHDDNRRCGLGWQRLSMMWILAQSARSVQQSSFWGCYQPNSQTCVWQRREEVSQRESMQEDKGCCTFPWNEVWIPLSSSSVPCPPIPWFVWTCHYWQTRSRLSSRIYCQSPQPQGLQECCEVLFLPFQSRWIKTGVVSCRNDIDLVHIENCFQAWNGAHPISNPLCRSSSTISSGCIKDLSNNNLIVV